MTADQDIGRTHTEPMLRGWKAIADYLEISPLRAQERAKWPRDPLPVYFDHRGPLAYVSALREWVGRTRMAYKAHLQLNGRGRKMGQDESEAQSCQAPVSTEKRRPRGDAT